jgi:hypothetical protein
MDATKEVLPKKETPPESYPTKIDRNALLVVRTRSCGERPRWAPLN